MQQYFKSYFPDIDLRRGRTVHVDAARVPPHATYIVLSDQAQNLECLSQLRAIQALCIDEPRQTDIQTISALSHLRLLCIRETRVEDLSLLSQLQHLECLVITGASRLTSLEFLRSLRGLRALGVVDAKRLRDVAPLAGLRQLRELNLSGGLWNKLSLISLEPLRHLQSLEYLWLLPDVKESTLEPLGGLRGLKQLWLNHLFPMEDYAKLAGKLSQVRSEQFTRLFWPLDLSICKRCGQNTMVLPVGKGQKVLCRNCDVNRITRYRKAFQTIKRQAASRTQW